MSLIMAEYRCPCPEHDVFELLVERTPLGEAPDEAPCALCGLMSRWTMSAPHPKVWSVPCYAAVRGGDMKDSERPKGMLNTRNLGDGKQTMNEWKATQRENGKRRRHEQLVKMGAASKKVIV